MGRNVPLLRSWLGRGLEVARDRCSRPTTYAHRSLVRPYDSVIRSASQRHNDAVSRLETEPNVWLATASADGVPHLIPLSLAWDGDRLLLATPTDSPTVRNALATGAVKASLDSADDVVLIDGTVQVADFASADPTLVNSYVQRVGWNPANEQGAWSLLVVSPRTVRTWRGVAEITGRTVMKQGVWVDQAG